MSFKKNYEKRKTELQEVEVLGEKVYFKRLPISYHIANSKREDKAELGYEVLSLRLVEEDGKQAYTVEEIKELDSELLTALLNAIPEDSKKKTSPTLNDSPTS